MSLVKTVGRLMMNVGKEGFKVGKRLSRITELNIALKIERDKQQACYKEIGEHVHIDQVGETISSPKIRALREQIVVQERKIKGLVEEINLLKRINSCAYCGYVSKEEQKYCPKCSRPRK